MFNREKELFEQSLKEFFYNKKTLYPEKLFSAMEHSLFNGGKRVRPILMMLSSELVKLSYEYIMPFAISLECIHTYSLIHDDLPCMDNDDMRRGKPTSHKLFGEAMALLAGDCLLNLAYENLLDAVGNNPDSIEAAKYLAKCAGGEGMVAGQAIEFSKDYFDESEITELCMKKTGALICASIMAPCLIAADNEKITALGSFATAVGLSFQLSDDLIDKNKGEKKSYLGIVGEEKTIEMLNKLEIISNKALSKWENESKKLRDYSSFLAKRKV